MQRSSLAPGPWAFGATTGPAVRSRPPHRGSFSLDLDRNLSRNFGVWATVAFCLLLLAQTAAATAADGNAITVTVGGTGLLYTHASIAANVSDSVVFRFSTGNHSVVQSSFETPCEPLEGGFNSGYLPVQGESSGSQSFNPVEFVIQITQSEPIYYYCSQPGHCQAGMVGTINAPYDAADSFVNYSSAAVRATTYAAPTTVGGGTWVDSAASPAWSATATRGASEAVTSPPGGGATGTSMGAGSGTSAAPSASQTGRAGGRPGAAALALWTAAVVLGIVLSA